MRKPKPPRLVTVAIFTTVTIVFWIFYSVYQILTTDAPVNVSPELLEPISPELDFDALNQVGDRRYFEEGQTVPLSIVNFEGQGQNAIEEGLEQEPEQEVATEASELEEQ